MCRFESCSCSKRNCTEAAGYKNSATIMKSIVCLGVGDTNHIKQISLQKPIHMYSSRFHYGIGHQLIRAEEIRSNYLKYFALGK